MVVLVPLLGAIMVAMTAVVTGRGTFHSFLSPLYYLFKCVMNTHYVVRGPLSPHSLVPLPLWTEAWFLALVLEAYYLDWRKKQNLLRCPPHRSFRAITPAEKSMIPRDRTRTFMDLTNATRRTVPIPVATNRLF